MASEPVSHDKLLQELHRLRAQQAHMQQLQARCQTAEAALKAIEKRNQVLGDSAPFGIFTTDLQGGITGFNRKIRDMLPWPPDKAASRLTIDTVPALAGSGVGDDFRRCLDTKRALIRDYPCIDINGACLHLRFYISPVADDSGTISGTMAFVENYSALKLAQATAMENEQRYRLLFQSAPIAMIERDASQLKSHLAQLQLSDQLELRRYLQQHPEQVGRCMGLIKTVDCNDAFLDLLESDDKEAVMSGMPLIAFGEHYAVLAEEVILTVAHGKVQQERELTIHTMQGRRKWVLTRALVIAGHEETMARIVISFADITKRKEAEEALRTSEQRFREQSLHDNLTGLFNRRYLYRTLSDLLASTRQTHSPLSVLFMDLDDFKQIVDVNGHLNGSRVIQEVAGTIRQTLTPPAFAVAFAGDEFVVVLPGADQSRAAQKASEIQALIKDTAYLQSLGKAVQVQASCGIATCPTHGSDVDELLAAADHALFTVKGKGKGKSAIARLEAPDAG
jgi:diguanylate cyclase (GGDEF)-like protein/PAS domain S-box-containing protein